MIKKLLRRWVLRDILCSVNPFDVLTVTKNGLILLNGEQIAEAELKQLKGEVGALKEFMVWRVLNQTVRQKAIEMSMYQSTSFEQVLSGKLMLHVLGLQESIMKVIDDAKV